ncbi:MAG: hypothetical protein JWO46_746 [Nocardioidaceae bacterium]|nr:hypothetical protein [Nocardioidaceae bacterium]
MAMQQVAQRVLSVVETYESCGPKQQSTRDVLAAVRAALETPPVASRYETELQADLATRVRSAGVPQTVLAERTGFSEKHVSQMLTGAAAGTLKAWQRLLVAATSPAVVPDDDAAGAGR